ncbi:MAG TPA: non-homologous end-joining DNA ligase, partial [Labilithrix sp.]|nr:non-homologous end-joining DNA ligase [Labilithrix sp.]
ASHQRVTKADAKGEPASAHARAARAKEDAKPRVDGIVVSHPERVIDPSSGLTKLDLVRYAGEIAETMFPFVVKRPLMLLRCPGGTQDSVFRQSDKRTANKRKPTCFVQKHSGQGLNAQNLGSMVLGKEEALFVTNTKQIVLLAQNNAVEVHGWGCTVPKWDRPDWIVFDLDPDENLPFSRVIESAFEVREALRTLSLESWVKTTGGKGLHVVVPLARHYDWDTIRSVSERIAVLLAQGAPHRYVATMSKRARVGKIFIDYLRNGEGSTAILPYSARARPGLPVAVPIAWKDLRAVNPQELTILTVPKLVSRRKADPWADLLETKQTLPRELLTDRA